MTPSGENDPPYEIHCSGLIAKTLRQLQRRAALEGRAKEFLAALRLVQHRLTQEPLTFGEPLYRLAVLRMRVRTTVVRPLVVDFAVCEDRPLVFIKGVKLLSDQGN